MFGVSAFAGAPFGAQAENAFLANVVEAGEANNVVSSIVTLVVTEGATGSDIVLRRLQWELIDTSETTNWQTIDTSETTNWQTIDTSETTNWQTIPTIN